MYTNLGNICRNRDVGEKRSGASRLVAKNDEPFDKTLKA
jgi:hypothetical protein